MKIKFDKFQISGKTGDYKVEVYGDKINKKTGEKTYGIVRYRYHANLQNSLAECLSFVISEGGDSETIAGLKELMGAFKETIEETAKMLKDAK